MSYEEACALPYVLSALFCSPIFSSLSRPFALRMCDLYSCSETMPFLIATALSIYHPTSAIPPTFPTPPLCSPTILQYTYTPLLSIPYPVSLCHLFTCLTLDNAMNNETTNSPSQCMALLHRCAGLTAYSALHGPIPFKKGQSILIQGTSGVSMYVFFISSLKDNTTLPPPCGVRRLNPITSPPLPDRCPFHLLHFLSLFRTFRFVG